MAGLNFNVAPLAANATLRGNMTTVAVVATAPRSLLDLTFKESLQKCLRSLETR